jgi:hypothetical protein
VAIPRSSPPGRGQRLVVAIAVVLFAGSATCVEGLQPAPENRAATAEASVRLPPLVVLKDGSRLQAKHLFYSDTELELTFADGHKEVYPISEIDYDASVGLPRLYRDRPQPQPAQPRSPKPSRVKSFAGSKKLKLPEENAQANAVDAKGGDGTLSIGSTTYSNDTAPDGSGQGSSPIELQADIQALASGWSGFKRARSEVQATCSGYIQGRASCGASAVVSKRHTAYCRDAINRARARLPGLEAAHNEFWAGARRSGVSPGDVRAALRSRGLHDFRGQIDQANSVLDAWYGNLVD